MHAVRCFSKNRITLFFALTALLFLLPTHLPADDSAQQTVTVKSSPKAKIIKKLKTIIIGEINFKDASLPEIIEFLTLESKKSDPAHEGVSFLFNPDGATSPKPVTLELNKVPLQDAIRYSLYLADPRLHYEAENYAVCIRPDNGDRLCLRTFTVPTGFFGVAADKNGDEKQQLIAKGVQFSDGASATYFPANKSLVIRNTPDQIELIEELIDAATDPMIQANKTTHFVPINP
jgi:general secretion pathway protein D